MKTKTAKQLGFAMLVGILFSFTVVGGNEWGAPKEAKEIKNTISATPESISRGKEMFGKRCKACHGKKGAGNGPASIALNPHPADLTSARVQGETDGELFWKIAEGRNSMPSYKSSLKEAERWDLINYIKSL